MIWYHRAILAFCVIFVVLGVTILVRTASVGGGVVGFVVGGLFVALGVARFQVERKRGR